MPGDKHRRYRAAQGPLHGPRARLRRRRVPRRHGQVARAAVRSRRRGHIALPGREPGVDGPVLRAKLRRLHGYHPDRHLHVPARMRLRSVHRAIPRARDIRLWLGVNLRLHARHAPGYAHGDPLQPTKAEPWVVMEKFF